ncbi:MAG TPA: serine/threonine-protein kinase [Nannocystaceae bacterium]|nr:serine/threonine-protein kinase [Nannocystaceae bacterium]
MGIAAAADSMRAVSDGTRLGKYQLLRRLATGGMAELYLARAAGMAGFEKLVVLKRILPQHAESDEFIRMFLTEARLAATLHHPNIVQVYDIGEEAGTYFFTMEWVQGQDLRRLVRAARKAEQPIPLEHILHVMSGVAAGLHHAHEQADHDGSPMGIVHRDVSPSNVLVTYDGAVKIVDFGIAKAAAHQSNTIAGTLKGKIPYMSPEQCRGEGVDNRSDIFSIGTLLWELTTGSRLFAGENEIAIINRVAKAEVPLPSSVRPDYPKALETIVMRALAGDPQERYQHAVDLQIDLEDFAREARLPVSSARVGKFMRELFAEEIQQTAAQLQAERLDAAQSGQGPIPVAIPSGSSIERTVVEAEGIEIPSELIASSSAPRVESEISRSNSVTRSEQLLVDLDEPPKRKLGGWLAVGGVLALLAGGAAAFAVMPRTEAAKTDNTAAAATITATVEPEPTPAPIEPPKPALSISPATSTVTPSGGAPTSAAAPPAQAALTPNEQDEPVLIGDTSNEAKHKPEPEVGEGKGEKKAAPKSSPKKSGDRKTEPKKPAAADASKKPKWDLDNNPMPPM